MDQPSDPEIVNGDPLKDLRHAIPDHLESGVDVDQKLATMLADIAAGIERAEAAVNADKEERVRENTLRDKRLTTNRRMTRLAIAVGILAIAVAVGTILFARNQHRQDIEDRTEARFISCEQYNEGVVDKINNIMLTSLMNNPDRTPEQEAFVRSLLLLYRDCSPKGIEAYFDGTGGYLTPE